MIVLYDDDRARLFEPFATTRPLGEMRAGALLVRERWAHALHDVVAGFVSSDAQRTFTEFDAPPFVDAGASLTAGTIVANTRALPFIAARMPLDVDAWTIGGRVAAVRLRTPLDIAALIDGRCTLASDASRQTVEIDGVWLDEVWDIIRHLHALLASDIPALAAHLECTPLEDDSTRARGPVVVGAHPVWLETGAIVEPFTVFDTTLGPVLLRKGATVQSFTRVVGPCYVGRDSVIVADRISGSSIGDTCRVHGELSASVFIGHANKGHDGFVGHSIFGRWVNLGAGTVTSNLKNTYSTVSLWTPDGVRDTGLQFLGTFFGDHAKTGIGMKLNTGTVLGAGSNVMDAMPPKAVAPFSWGTRPPYEAFALTKFLETAARMMARRSVTLDVAQIAHLSAAYARVRSEGHWPSH